MNVVVSNVEWRAQASDDQHVDVAIVVDGMVNKLGSVEATPDLCAIRRASAKITELLCGAESFVAEVEPGELVVTHGRRVDRLPIGPSIAISVQPYRY